MALLSILISVLLEKFVTTLQNYRSFKWFTDYSGWITDQVKSAQGSWAILLIMAPIIITVALILAGTGPVLGFLLGLLILVYSLGPKDLEIQIRDFLDASEREDIEGSALYAQKIHPHLQPLDSQEKINQHVINAILIETNDRITAVIFWFLVLGPIGALLYRLSSQLAYNSLPTESDAEQYDAAQRLYYILNWIPARVTGFSYALGGSMADAMHNWRSCDNTYPSLERDGNQAILTSMGLGALQIDRESQGGSIENVQLCQALSNRAIIICISLIAVMTLAGFA